VDAIGIVTLVIVVALWVGAVVFPKDSRDGRGWFSRTGLGDRTPRIGD
jgi:hypothetical protein